MTEPKRWLAADSDAPEAVRSLLANAEQTAPIGSKALAASAASVTKLAAAPGAASLSLMTQVMLAVGTAGVVAVAIATSSPSGENSSPPTVVVATPEASGSSAEVPSAASVPGASSVVPVVEVPAVEVSSAEMPSGESVAAEVVAGRRSPNVLPAAEDLLATEVAQLDRVRALVGTNPSQALAQARAHGRLFPDGILRTERRLLEIEALARLGRRQEARRLAGQLLETQPSSMYRQRLEGIVGRL